MAVHQDEAIILRTRDYGESDRLVTVFTRRHGQLTGIAKGARRSKKRFVHTVEPFSHVRLTYAERQTTGLVRLDASELKNPFTDLREDLTRLGYASLGCELVLEMAPERQASPQIFLLLQYYLQQLNAGADPENTSLLFQIRFLCLSGYAPNLRGCLLCGQELPATETWSFSIPQGGLLCQAHGHGPQLQPLSPGTVMLLRQAQQIPLDKLWRLRCHPVCRNECRPLLLNLIRYHLDKDLKSLTLLEQIGSFQPGP